VTVTEDQQIFSWNLYCELRLETREAQKIRAQVIGFKIALVSASFGFIYGADSFEINLLMIPAFSAILFDYLIVGYGYCNFSKSGGSIHSILGIAFDENF
jgi:hypothetical protein